MVDQGEIVFMDRVSLRYREGVSVLKNLSLRLFPKSFHFLTGSSGAGKSSLLRLLYLGLRPTAGTLKIFGTDIQKMSGKQANLLRRRVGVVFQDFNLIEHLSVLENVMLPLKVRNEHPSARQEQARELLSWVGLEEYVDALIYFLRTYFSINARNRNAPPIPTTQRSSSGKTKTPSKILINPNQSRNKKEASENLTRYRRHKVLA